MDYHKLPLKKRILIRERNREDFNKMLDSLVAHYNRSSVIKAEEQAFARRRASHYMMQSKQQETQRALKAARAVGAAQRKKLAENRKKMTRLEKELASYNPAPGNVF
jgi:septal ring factor EnvC (AmiA/AmiB activator)